MDMNYNELDAPLKPGKLSSCRCRCGDKTVETKSYWVVNIVAAVLHLVNALLMLILYYENDQHDQLYNITTPYGSWKRNNETNTMEVISKSTTVVEDVSLNWLIFSFHIMSFVFQMLVLIPQYRYEQMVEQRGQNWLRFLEYSISASLMLSCIALTTGIRDFVTILSICALNIITQVLGAFNEYIRDSRIRTGSFTLAWFSNLAAYGIIFWYFGVAVEQTEIEVPGFVIGIIIGQFVIFNLFGLVQWIQIYGTKWAVIGAIGRESELSYCVLSLVAKTLLGWLIYANVIVSASDVVNNN